MRDLKSAAALTRRRRSRPPERGPIGAAIILIDSFLAAAVLKSDGVVRATALIIAGTIAIVTIAALMRPR